MLIFSWGSFKNYYIKNQKIHQLFVSFRIHEYLPQGMLIISLRQLEFFLINHFLAFLLIQYVELFVSYASFASIVSFVSYANFVDLYLHHTGIL